MMKSASIAPAKKEEKTVSISVNVLVWKNNVSRSRAVAEDQGNCRGSIRESKCKMTAQHCFRSRRSYLTAQYDRRLARPARHRRDPGARHRRTHRSQRGRQAPPRRRRRRRGHGGWTKCRKSSSMVCRWPRKRPSWLASALPSTATRRSRSAGGSWPDGRKAETAERAAHRLDVDRVRHDGVIDGERPAPLRRHAEHDDLVTQQFDACRATGAARPHVPVARRSAPRRVRALDSPSAMATPSALAARDSPIDFSVSRRRHASRRALSASPMRCAVSSGHLTCTKCTSAGSVMPASVIAACTAAATMSTCDIRPRCSAGSAGVCARPIASAGPLRSSPSARSNTVQCGAMPPSVPPDITRQSWPPAPLKDAAGTSGSARAPRSRARNR